MEYLWVPVVFLQRTAGKREMGKEASAGIAVLGSSHMEEVTGGFPEPDNV